MHPKDRMGYAIGFVVLILIACGPSSTRRLWRSYEAIGRRTAANNLLASVWGHPLGFTLVAPVALALIGLRPRD